MTRIRPIYLFDECIGEPIMRKLRESLATESEFVHITDLYTQGIEDEVWIPDAAAHGGYVVITADAGRNPRANKRKLPDICLEHKLTHIILSAKIHAEPSEKKMAVLHRVWSDIEKAAAGEAGCRYSIKYRNTRSVMNDAVELVEVDRSKKKRPK